MAEYPQGDTDSILEWNSWKFIGERYWLLQ